MAAYTHVMLTGQNTEHIDTAIADFNFHPIKTVYLLHSPNEKKATGYKTKPTLFKDLAKKCKKRIEGKDNEKRVAGRCKNNCKRSKAKSPCGVR